MAAAKKVTEPQAVEAEETVKAAPKSTKNKDGFEAGKPVSNADLFQFISAKRKK